MLTPHHHSEWLTFLEMSDYWQEAAPLECLSYSYKRVGIDVLPPLQQEKAPYLEVANP